MNISTCVCSYLNSDMYLPTAFCVDDVFLWSREGNKAALLFTIQTSICIACAQRRCSPECPLKWKCVIGTLFIFGASIIHSPHLLFYFCKSVAQSQPTSPFASRNDYTGLHTIIHLVPIPSSLACPSLPRTSSVIYLDQRENVFHYPNDYLNRIPPLPKRRPLCTSPSTLPCAQKLFNPIEELPAICFDICIGTRKQES